MQSDFVRVGVVGLGNMGVGHAKAFLDGKIPGGVLGAVADAVPGRRAVLDGVPGFEDAAGLIGSGLVDAVVVATPHPSHVEIGTASLAAGLHTLVEKPLSQDKAGCEQLIAAHRDPAVVFAAMFNQRTDPFYLKMRDLIRSGELGRIRRINWIITTWFRSEAYYRSGGWRATWEGEGGGVLLNQSPHNLDLWQWMFGMPDEIWADCQLGRYHDIEVEDDVTAFMKYPGGTTGIFITSTGEAPGTNRLEVVAERGRLVYEEGRLQFLRNEQEMSEFSRTTASAFSVPPLWNVSIPLDPNHHGEQHVGILKNFVSAIREGTPLIAPGEEGIHSVELANAMLLSAARGCAVQLPLDSSEYAELLAQRVRESTKVKSVDERVGTASDFANSFSK